MRSRALSQRPIAPGDLLAVVLWCVVLAMLLNWLLT